MLSRIAAAGLDYTQRANKLAHHVALEAGELVPAGPAALLTAPGVMTAEWTGEPRLLAERRLPAVAAAAAICRAWQAASGDAGWGGVVAESAAGSAVRPVLLIYPPGTDVLPLLAEALALLPPERRWEVTFSTYYTRLPAGVDCQWRGLVAGSPEALAARHVPGALLVDLSRPLPAAQGGALVALARTGRAAITRASGRCRRTGCRACSPATAAGRSRGLRTGHHTARTFAGGAGAGRRCCRSATGASSWVRWPAVPPAWQPPRRRAPPIRPAVRWPWMLTAGVGLFLCGTAGRGRLVATASSPRRRTAGFANDGARRTSDAHRHAAGAPAAGQAGAAAKNARRPAAGGTRRRSVRKIRACGPARTRHPGHARSAGFGRAAADANAARRRAAAAHRKVAGPLGRDSAGGRAAAAGRGPAAGRAVSACRRRRTIRSSSADRGWSTAPN